MKKFIHFSTKGAEPKATAPIPAHVVVSSDFHRHMANDAHEAAHATLVTAGVAAPHAKMIVDGAHNGLMKINGQIRAALPASDESLSKLTNQQRINFLMRERGLSQLDAVTLSNRIQHRFENAERSTSNTKAKTK